MAVFSKIKQFFSDHSDYVTLLNDVRKSEMLDNMPVVKELVNTPIVDDYFKRTLKENYKEDSYLEKSVAVAAAKMASEKFGWNQEKSIEAAIQAAEFLRDARRNYKLAKNEISQLEYQEHKKVSFFGKVWGTAKSLWVNCNGKVKDWVKDKGFSWLLKKAAKYCPVPVVKVATHVWDAIPEPAKKLVKEGAKKVADWAVDKLPVVVENLCNAGKEVVVKSAKILAKGYEVAKSVGRAAVSAGKKIYEGAKSVCKTVYESVKSTVKSVASALNPFNWF